MKKYLTEIERSLKATQQELDESYKSFRSKTTKLHVLGHRLPAMHQLMSGGFSFFDKPSTEILAIWNYIWITSNIHEAMSLPLFYYRRHKFTFGKKEWDVMKHWADRIENWEHSDALAHLYSYVFERHPSMVLPTLRQWNRSKEPWKQRLSITSLIYYASKNRKAPDVDLVLAMVEPLIKSRDKYVSKAVGWTLRESYKLYPKPTLMFIKNHVGELAPDAFSYATEKVDKTTKVQLKEKREISRLRSR